MIRLFLLVIALVCALPAAALAQAAPAGSAAAPSPHAAPNPHAPQQRAQDRSVPAADLPAGAIEATIHDGRGNPQAGIEVRLGIKFQTVAEGERSDQKFAKTDAEGRVRFDGLKFDSSYSYRVTVKHGPAEYASSPFNLRNDSGQRVLLHVYASTSEFDKVSVRMQGFLYIAPRDDLFQFEVLYRVYNMGENTWIPRDTVVTLPRDFKAFKADESMSDTRFELVEGRGAKLKGTFSPGQHQLVFRFQTPKGTDETASFDMGLPPGMVEMRVIAEANPTMTMQVDGFESTKADVAQNGTRVLVTRKVAERGGEDVRSFTAVLTGLPQPGLGRWIAALIAMGLAGVGLASARGVFDQSIDTGSGVEQDRVHARKLILDELVALERARQKKAIGPGAYQRLHQELLDALARVGAGTPQRRKKSKKKAASTRSRPPSAELRA